MCLYPTIIRNPKYKANKKNGGIIPAISDIRVLAVPIGCKLCIECRRQKANEWRIRLQEEVKHDERGKFITLTFSNESLEYIKTQFKESLNKKTGKKEKEQINGIKGWNQDNAIATYAIRHYLELYRKHNKKSLKHWFITELGKATDRIHIHGIVWSEQDHNEITKHWQYGITWPMKQEEIDKTYVNNATINYMIKYITKKDEKHKEYIPVILCSKGIGKQYTNTIQSNRNKYRENKTKETYKINTGQETAIPIYYRNKIYSEVEREKLWLEKLDKNIRWVNGTKINIEKNMDEYFKKVNYERKRTEQLGYGQPNNWKKEKYEDQLKLTKRNASGGPSGGVGRPTGAD